MNRDYLAKKWSRGDFKEELDRNEATARDMHARSIRDRFQRVEQSERIEARSRYVGEPPSGELEFSNFLLYFVKRGRVKAFMVTD